MRAATTTWRTFLKAQASGTFGADFFEVDRIGYAKASSLFVIEHASRTEHIRAVTMHPNAGSDTQCARIPWPNSASAPPVAASNSDQCG